MNALVNDYFVSLRSILPLVRETHRPADPPKDQRTDRMFEGSSHKEMRGRIKKEAENVTDGRNFLLVAWSKRINFKGLLKLGPILF